MRKWTYLLFDEFFEQGDTEKAQSLPVSFLCDRLTTNVAKSQNGFISFIVLPLFTQVTELMPGIACMLESGKQNKALWDKHEETEQEKQIYTKPESLLGSVQSEDCDSDSNSHE